MSRILLGMRLTGSQPTDRSRSRRKGALVMVAASEAEAGKFYKSLGGQVLQVVDTKKVTGRWRAQSDPLAIPYRIKANAAGKRPQEMVAIYGWLPAQYSLALCPKPGWWRRADAKRVRSLRRRKKH